MSHGFEDNLYLPFTMIKKSENPYMNFGPKETKIIYHNNIFLVFLLRNFKATSLDLGRMGLYTIHISCFTDGIRYQNIHLRTLDIQTKMWHSNVYKIISISNFFNSLH